MCAAGDDGSINALSVALEISATHEQLSQSVAMYKACMGGAQKAEAPKPEAPSPEAQRQSQGKHSIWQSLSDMDYIAVGRKSCLLNEDLSRRSHSGRRCYTLSLLTSMLPMPGRNIRCHLQ